MTYELIDNSDDFENLMDRIGGAPCALDFEGWDYKVRLAQFCNDDVFAVVDFGEVGNGNWFYDVAEWFDDGVWIAFQSTHEKKCFAGHDAYPTVWDVGHLRRAIEGGGHMSLKTLVGWEVTDEDGNPVEMDKTEQASDWNTGELTQSQLDYAADDAIYTWKAWKALKARATPGHMSCFNMLDSMADAVMEMEDSGLKLDPVHHQSLIDQWQKLSNERTAAIREMVTEKEVANLNSGKQWTDFFVPILPDGLLDPWPTTEKTGLLSMKNTDLIDMAGYFGDNFLSTLLRTMAERSTLEKYLSSFGSTLLRHAEVGNGRVHARYNIGAAITCRFSSSGPNLQQIPRDRDFFGERLSIRQGFIAEPGNVLVSYDYSGIEMVVMALVSGDEQLLEDVLYGDVHSEAASMIAGRKVDPKNSVEDKELRQQGKPINFGIIYGTSPLGLAGRQGWTYDFAEGVIDQWARRYPKAWGLRDEMQQEARETGYLTMVDGGTIWLGKKKPGLTKCANYPIQRGALSVMARAIARHKDSMDDLREDTPQSKRNRVMMCSTIHDALIDECPAAMGEQVMRQMKEDMLLGYYDVFPQLRDLNVEDRLLEGGLGPNWGQLEEV